MYYKIKKKIQLFCVVKARSAEICKNQTVSGMKKWSACCLAGTFLVKG